MEFPAVGTRLGRYTILEQIGAGGMGIVYRVHDDRLDRDVALKVLPPGTIGDENARRRLRHEALSLSRVNHPNIATVHDFDTQDGVDFLVSELVSGVSLDEKLAGGPLAEPDVIRVGSELADGLVAAHAQGIIHRDLKPSNLRLTSDGRLKILDFGIARIQRAPDAATLTSTEVDTIAGTLAYMAPEQLRGEPADTRSDIWAAGVVLFEMATGTRPFHARTDSALAGEILHAVPVPLREYRAALSAGLENIILKCLEKDPTQRYQSAAELRVDLRRLTASPVAARPRGIGRRPAILAASVVLVVLAAVAAYGWRSWRVHDPLPEATLWYERGMTALRDGAFYSAARMFDRSIAIDRDFALAHARLAEIWMELDEGNRARQELLLAVPPGGLKRRVTPLEERYLDAIYGTVTGDYDGALKRYEAIAHATPDARSIEVQLDLARAMEKARRPDDAFAVYEDVTRQSRAYAAAFLRKGAILSRKGKFREALASVDEGLQLHRTANNIEGVAVALHQRALIEVSQGSRDDAERDLGQALDLARNTGNLLIQVRALVELARQAGLRGDTALAERHAKEAADLGRSQGAENLITRAALAQGNVFLMKGDHARAEAHYREGLTLARRFHTEDLEARMLFGLASTHTQQFRAADAVAEIEQALAFFEKRQAQDDIVLSRLVLGRALRLQGELGRSLEVFTRARDAARNMGIAASERLAIQGISTVLQDAERLPEALDRIHEAQSANSKDTLGYAYDTSTVGDIQWQLGRAAEARGAYKEAAQIAAKAGYDDLLRTVELGLANLELSQGAWRDAERRAKRLSRDLPEDYRADLDAILSRAATAAGQHAEALRLAQHAVELTQKHGAVTLRRRAELVLAEAELRSGASRDAAARALRLEAEFNKWGQLESRWRTLAIAAEATRATGDEVKAVEYASTATRVLADFEQRLGPAFADYRARKDVQRLVSGLSPLRRGS